MELYNAYLTLTNTQTVLLLTVAGTLLYLLGTSLTAVKIGSVFRVKVLRVCDGDTLIVRGWIRKFRVRLAGMDAPESDQKGGAESQKQLQKLIGVSFVRLRVVDKDHWGRYVAFVYSRGRNLNLEMVRAGHAWAYRQYFFNLEKDEISAFIQAETEARDRHLGIWNSDKPETPWAYRKAHRDMGTWLHFLWLWIKKMLFGRPKRTSYKRYRKRNFV